MGMRMNVAVGYGLDLTGLNTEFISDFENMESKELFNEFLTEAIKSAEARGDISDKMSIGFAVGTKCHRVDDNEVPRAFYQTAEYDSEFAFEDKLLLYPLGYKKSWSRYSDLLDAFIWEAQKGDGADYMQNEWVEKPGTLYPFVGLMRANSEKPLGVEEYWESVYLDKEEFKSAIPKAPLHLWHLIRHLKLTETDEETTRAFLSLRPSFMRWWS